jgi:hypothetical protein
MTAPADQAHAVLLADDHHPVAAVLDLVQPVRRAERYVEAIRFKYGNDSAEYAVAINSRAAVYTARRPFGQAEPLLRRALGIDEKTYGSEHRNLRKDLNNVAQMLQMSGCFRSPRLLSDKRSYLRQ